MTLKVANLLLMLIVCVLLTIQPLTSSPLENEKLEELTNRLDRLQTEVDSLKAEKVAATERFERLETKVVSLEVGKVELKEQFATMLTKMEKKWTARIDDLEAENSQHDEEISHLNSQISNPESLLPPESASYYGTNQSLNKNDGLTPRATTPPSSCEELTGYTNFVGMDGIHLVKNKVTKKIEAVFCQFSQRPVVQELVGTVDMKTKTVQNAKLDSDVKELKFQMATQDGEIQRLRNIISEPESTFPPTLASYATDKQMKNNASNTYKNGGLSSRASTPPSSCNDLWGFANLKGTDGIYLVKDDTSKRIQAVFCRFISEEEISQEFIGNVDVKTKTVHFYVQRNSNFGTKNAVIPFQEERLNEGNAFNLASGIFTVPVPGIYHFDFSAVKSQNLIYTYLTIYLQVNGAEVGVAYTYQSVENSNDAVSLSASLRLAAGDKVNLFNYGGGYGSGLYDNSNHLTHFNGWLVEEDLM